MPYYKFKKNDLFYNRIETHPKCEFWMYNGSVTYNNRPHLTGALVNSGAPCVAFPEDYTPLHNLTLNGPICIDEGITLTLDHDPCVAFTIDCPGATAVGHITNGDISLYELNVDRHESLNDSLVALGLSPKGMIFPFITKEGSLTSFKTVSTGDFNKDFQYGDTMSGSYPLNAGISKERYAQGAGRSYIEALKNTLDYYTYLSPHYAYSSASFSKNRANPDADTSSIINWNKGLQEIGLVSIPSIFYGSSIQKGTVDLKFFITGTMIGRLQDEKRNGELIQVEPKDSAGSGSVAGVILYNEGFVVLTGSWDLRGSAGKFFPGTETTSDYIADSDSKKTSQWIYFAQNISSSVGVPEASFFMACSGTNYTPVITMLAHAKRGELNYSNNPTFVQQGQSLSSNSSSFYYKQPKDISPTNTISSSFCGFKTPYKKQTFISKVGIYDKDKNLIAIANLATPVRKLEDDDYTFKLKLDI